MNLASYHAHSRWSDGKSTVGDMVAAAAAKALAEFGLSDHWARNPGHADYPWAIPQARLDEYVADIQAAARTAALPVRLGIEFDYFPDTEPLMAEVLQRHPFDYAIGSVHFAEDFPIDADPRYWDGLSQARIDDIFRLYWRDLRRVAESRLFDFVGHLDLPKKFGHRPSVGLDAEISAALDAIAAAGLAVELNAAGWDKPCADAYPSEPLLRECHRRHIPALVSDDAHHVDEIGRHAERAIDRLRRAGYRETVRFHQRQRTTVPLPE